MIKIDNISIAIEDTKKSDWNKRRLNLQERSQWRSSLIYNTSTRHEPEECGTSETRATRVRHKCDTNATRMTQVRHECYTNDTSATWVKNFDFDNVTIKDIFLPSYIYYIASKRLRGKKEFDSKNYFFTNASFPCQNAFENFTTKTKPFNGKDISKSYKLDCICTLMPLHVPA